MSEMRLRRIRHGADCMPARDLCQAGAAALGQVGLIDEIVVVDQVTIPVVGLTAEEAVIKVKAVLQRLLRLRPAGADVLFGRVVVSAQQ